MSAGDLEKLLQGEPVDGATVRQRRKWLILKFVANFPEGVHEETVCAGLDMVTGLTHYRLKVYIHELDRGGYIHRKETGIVKLAKPLERIYSDILKLNPRTEVPP